MQAEVATLQKELDKAADELAGKAAALRARKDEEQQREAEKLEQRGERVRLVRAQLDIKFG
jgi:hypothetical protein